MKPKKSGAKSGRDVRFTADSVAKIAGLANIPVSPGEETDLADGFNATIAVVDQLFALDTSGTEPTHQVTDLENVMREDEVDSDRTFSQEDALKNAVRTYNGYFVVDRIIP